MTPRTRTLLFVLAGVVIVGAALWLWGQVA
jgi:hypothetical protein